MSCPDPQIISAFADGELETNEAAEIEQHLAQCASCQRFLVEMQLIEGHGRAALEAIDARDGNVKNIVYGKPLWLMWGSSMPLAAAAAVVAICIGGWLAFSHLGKQQTALPLHQVADASNSSNESHDAAFAQWVDPYRKLNIPLVPMEVAASYNPVPILPTLPDNIEKNRL